MYMDTGHQQRPTCIYSGRSSPDLMLQLPAASRVIGAGCVYIYKPVLPLKSVLKASIAKSCRRLEHNSYWSGW